MTVTAASKQLTTSTTDPPTTSSQTVTDAEKPKPIEYYGATGVKVMAGIAYSPIGIFVLVPIVAIIGVPINAAMSLFLLATHRGTEVRFTWQTYYRSIAMCFVGVFAYRRAKRHHGDAKIETVDPEHFTTIGPFASKRFRAFVGWIGQTYDSTRRYPAAFTSSKKVEMEEPFEDDEMRMTRDGMDCRTAPFSFKRSDLESLGIPCGEDLTGVPHGDGAQLFQPVVIWFDGTRTFSDAWQCAANLCGVVPPAFYDADDIFQDRQAAVRAYNANPANTPKLFIFLAGHSGGGQIAASVGGRNQSAALAIDSPGVDARAARNFIGERNLEFAARSGFIYSIFAEGDDTADPMVSSVYRPHVGIPLRLRGYAPFDHFGHFEYRDMLGAFGCGPRPRTTQQQERQVQQNRGPVPPLDID
jgi:hypothetical protein